MAKNFSTAMVEALMRHDIDLLRVEADLRRQIIGVLNGMEKDIVLKIKRFDPSAGTTATAKNKQLGLLTGATGPNITRAYKQIKDISESELIKLSAVQSELVRQQLNRLITVDLATEKLSPEVLRLLPGKAMIEGAPIDAWWSKQSTEFGEKFLNQMRQGIVANENIDQLARRIRGTQAGGFKDGIMGATRRQAQTLARSSVLATANKAREATYKKNNDVLKGMQWLSTLDGRTSDICIALDGQAWDMNGEKLGDTTVNYQGPPPAHFNCRSTLVPITKSFSELNKNPKHKKKLDELSKKRKEGLRASMNGAVSDKLKYPEWLAKQPQDFQIQVLGTTKWKLWQAGQLSLRDLIDQSHNPLSIDALVAKFGIPPESVQSAVAAGKAAEAAAKQAEKELLAQKIKQAQLELAKQEAAAASQEAKERALEKAAQWQIDTAKQNNTAWLAPAINALEKKGLDKSLSAKDFLKQANELAGKNLQRSNVQKFKKLTLAGKPVPPEAQAAFDALPSAKQKKLADEIAKIQAEKAAASEAAQKAAQHQLALQKAKLDIEEIAAQNATFEKRALIKLQKANALEGLDEIEQLAKIKQQAEIDKAAKKVQDGISKYKKAVLANKTPPPSAVEVFNELDDVAKAKVLADIEKQVAKTKVETAFEPSELVAAVQQDKLSVKDAYAQLLKAIGHEPTAEDIENFGKLYSGDIQKATIDNLVKVLKVQLGEIATKAQLSVDDVLEEIHSTSMSNLTAFKKLSAALGKPLDAAQIKLFEELSSDGKFNALEGLMADAQAASKAAKSAPKPTAQVTQPTGAPDVSKMTKIGGQKGSNEGGFYQDPDTGIKWYVKFPSSEDIARNEVLAGKLYERLGIEVPELHLVQQDGRTGIASKIIDGLSENSSMLTAGKATGAAEGFAADAWLANWDVVGLSYDNLLVKAGRAIRVDTGGALRYRAQGGLKGQAFGDTVSEIDSLRNASLNRQSASVFTHVTDEDIRRTVERIVGISDDEIRNVVALYGPTDASEQRALANTLIARKEDLRKRFLKTVEKPKPRPAPADNDAFVNDFEVQQIENGRLNGFALNRDGGDIEDQMILAWHETTADGVPRSMLQLKTRGKASKSLQERLDDSGARIGEVKTRKDVFFDTNELDADILTAVKGLAYRTAKNEALELKDIERAKRAVNRYKEMRDSLRIAVKDGEVLDVEYEKFVSHFRPWAESLETYTEASPGTKFGYKGPSAKFNTGFGTVKRIVKEEPKKKDADIHWKKTHGNFERKEIVNGNARGTGEFYEQYGIAYQTEIEGITVRWFDPRDNTDFFALKDRLEVIAPGKTHEQALNVLKRLGINVDRATDFDAEELYLRQIAFHRRDNFADFNSTVNRIKDPEQRIKRMREWLSEQIGQDITTLPAYNFKGQFQAFEQGRRHLFRPDLIGDEWEKFQKTYVVRHNITQGGDVLETVEKVLNSGGQMAPTTDKLRRGLPVGGMSPDADLRTGGASYFFTRIASKRSALGHPGFVWKSRLLGRLDAISYGGDKYGRVTGNTIQEYRRVGVKEWKSAAGISNNETIFKESLSLFDDLEAIVVEGETQRRAVIRLLKEHKIEQWPDGRKLEDVVLVRNR